jgi:hypothetical protein
LDEALATGLSTARPSVRELLICGVAIFLTVGAMAASMSASIARER